MAAVAATADDHAAGQMGPGTDCPANLAEVETQRGMRGHHLPHVQKRTGRSQAAAEEPTESDSKVHDFSGNCSNPHPVP